MSKRTSEQMLSAPKANPADTRIAHLFELCAGDEEKRERLDRLIGIISRHTQSNDPCWNATSSGDQRRVEGLELQSGAIGECLAMQVRRVGGSEFSEAPCGIDPSQITRRRCNGCPEYREKN